MKKNTQIDRQEFDHINEKLVRLVISLLTESDDRINFLGITVISRVAPLILRMYDQRRDPKNELKGIVFEMDASFTILNKRIELTSQSDREIQPDGHTFITFIEARYYLYALYYKYEKNVSMEEAITFYHSRKENELRGFMQENNFNSPV